MLISNELIRISMLWTELWHDALENGAKACFLYKSPKDMIKLVLPLHIQFETIGPQTVKEFSFINLYGREFENVFEIVKLVCVLMQFRYYYEDLELDKYIYSCICNDPNVIGKLNRDILSIVNAPPQPQQAQTTNQQLPPQALQNQFTLPLDPLEHLLHLLTPGQQQGLLDRYIQQIWEIYGSIHRRLEKSLKTQSTVLDLAQVSPLLLHAQHLEVILPGTYILNQPLLLIVKFDHVLNILDSKQRPRTMQILGNDGLLYKYLLKGHEDLRQDERVMQIFGLINVLLLNNISFQLYNSTSDTNDENNKQQFTPPTTAETNINFNVNQDGQQKTKKNFIEDPSDIFFQTALANHHNNHSILTSRSLLTSTSSLVAANQAFTYQKSNMYKNWNAYLFKQHYINMIMENSSTNLIISFGDLYKKHALAPFSKASCHSSVHNIEIRINSLEINIA
jgi:hypothetical protein